MMNPRSLPSDAMVRQACGFTKRWLRSHGLEAGDVYIYQGRENDKSTDVILLSSDQFDLIKSDLTCPFLPDQLGLTYLVFLPIPSDG